MDRFFEQLLLENPGFDVFSWSSAGSSFELNYEAASPNLTMATPGPNSQEDKGEWATLWRFE